MFTLGNLYSTNLLLLEEVGIDWLTVTRFDA